MIKLNNIKKVYNSGDCKTIALNGINLCIEHGEYASIMGTSGSGKSTLLNIIGGMDDITEGEYFYDDIAVHNLKGNALHEFRKQHISFIFQQFALMNHYTVYENVEIPLIAKGLPKKIRKEVIMEKLELMKISDLAQKLPTHISGGQQQRCAIARALASDNDLLLADEPTGALDSKTGMEMMDILTQINKAGKTVIVITHDINVAQRTDKIIRIEDGKFFY